MARWRLTDELSTLLSFTFSSPSSLVANSVPLQLTRAFGYRYEVVDCRAAPPQVPTLRKAELPQAEWSSCCPPAHSHAHLRRGRTRLGAGPHGQECSCSHSVAVLNCGICAAPDRRAADRPESSITEGVMLARARYAHDMSGALGEEIVEYKRGPVGIARRTRQP